MTSCLAAFGHTMPLEEALEKVAAMERGQAEQKGGDQHGGPDLPRDPAPGAQDDIMEQNGGGQDGGNPGQQQGQHQAKAPGRQQPKTLPGATTEVRASAARTEARERARQQVEEARLQAEAEGKLPSQA